MVRAFEGGPNRFRDAVLEYETMESGTTTRTTNDSAGPAPDSTTARLTAVALARPTRIRSIWRTIRADATQHPSPNGGIIEAAFAAAIDVQLGGTNR